MANTESSRTPSQRLADEDIHNLRRPLQRQYAPELEFRAHPNVQVHNQPIVQEAMNMNDALFVRIEATVLSKIDPLQLLRTKWEWQSSSKLKSRSSVLVDVFEPNSPCGMRWLHMMDRWLNSTLFIDLSQLISCNFVVKSMAYAIVFVPSA